MALKVVACVSNTGLCGGGGEERDGGLLAPAGQPTEKQAAAGESTTGFRAPFQLFLPFFSAWFSRHSLCLENETHPADCKFSFQIFKTGEHILFTLVAGQETERYLLFIL